MHDKTGKQRAMWKHFNSKKIKKINKKPLKLLNFGGFFVVVTI